MRVRYAIPSAILLVALFLNPASAQQKLKLGDNAALRYYAAFAEMQDSAITDKKAQELNAILDGPVPYDDLKFADLVEKNRPALELMARGTALPNCDWGLDYQLGEDTPVDYARNALALGRLNVLYAFHLRIAHDNGGAVRALVAGLRFSRDVANGGSLFAAVVAKDLMVQHLRAVQFVLQADKDRPSSSASHMADIRKAIAELGANGLDWKLATRRDLEVLRAHFANDAEASIALTRIIPTYIGTLNEPGKLPALEQALASAPHQLSEVIPNPKRVLEEKQDLTDKLRQARSKLQRETEPG
jgi:hypothetical protein